MLRAVSLLTTLWRDPRSELLRLFFQPYVKGSRELKQLASKYAAAENESELQSSIAKEYGDKYKQIKQEQLRFIVENKSNIASIYALKQRLPGDEYLFEANSDLYICE